MFKLSRPADKNRMAITEGKMVCVIPGSLADIYLPACGYKILLDQVEQDCDASYILKAFEFDKNILHKFLNADSRRPYS